MYERTFEVVTALVKLGAISKDRRLDYGLNASEAGVFWGITSIATVKPDTELFSLKELNSYLGYTRPNLSQTINKLEDKNYVRRVVLKDDRRLTYIKLTDEGKSILNRTFDELRCKINAITEKFGEDDMNSFIALANRFSDICEEIQ